MAVKDIKSGVVAAMIACDVVVEIGPANTGFTFALQAATRADAISHYGFVAKTDDERQMSMELGQNIGTVFTSQDDVRFTSLLPGAQTQRRSALWRRRAWEHGAFAEGERRRTWLRLRYWCRCW